MYPASANLIDKGVKLPYEWIKFTGAPTDLEGGGAPKAEYDGSVLTWKDDIKEVRGTSTDRNKIDTAGTNFFQQYAECAATSGDARGIYNRLYITGAGGGGESLRAFTTVENVAGATARGAHISLSFGASGSITGLGAALETTLHMPSGGGMAGTNCSLKVAINADGADADPAGATEISFIRIEAQGTQAGIDDLEDDGYFFSIQGFTADNDASHMLSSVSLAELPTNVGIRVKIGASIYYIPCVAQAGWN